MSFGLVQHSMLHSILSSNLISLVVPWELPRLSFDNPDTNNTLFVFVLNSFPSTFPEIFNLISYSVLRD